MRAIFIIGVAVVGVYFFYQSSTPKPSPYAGSPPEMQKYMQETAERVKKDADSDFGRGAIDVCRHRLGIKERVKTVTDVTKLGYGVDKASAFADCVVDIMYPVK